MQYASFSGLTCQNMITYATQQNKELRTMVVSELVIHPTHTLVLLDETGTDRRDCLCKKGCSVHCHPGQAQKLLITTSLPHCASVSRQSNALLVE